jgi:hypothetical protein
MSTNNQHFQSGYNLLKSRFSLDSINMSMTDWVCKNTTMLNKPFTVERYKFQREILDDMHPNMDTIKCSQIGLTEGQIRKALGFLSRNRGTSLIFTLPDNDLRDRVSKTRVRPIVDGDKVFNPDGSSPSRTNQIIQIGDSWMFLTGDSEKDATSTSADAVFNDEVDLSDQKMLSLFNSRLQNSDWKLSQRFSTPTFPSYGIDQGFAGSDHRLYKVKCDCCGHWQWPEFTRKFVDVPGLPDHIEKLTDITQEIVDEIDISAATVNCEKCHKPLDLGRDDNRQWVAKFPGRTHHRGYHVTPFSTDRLSPAYIITQLLKYRKTGFLRGFHNTVLGKAYSDGDIRLEEDTIKACLKGPGVPEIGKDTPVWIGIDMGITCHIVLGTGSCAEDMNPFLFKTVNVKNLKTVVVEFLKEYNIVGGTSDRHPYTPTVDEIYELSDGKIIPVEYRGSKDYNLVMDLIDESKVSHAQADRTSFIDTVATAVKDNTLLMRGYGHFEITVIEHLRDMVRDEQPDKPATWKKLTGEDHFFHALGFLCFAPKIRDLVVIKQKLEVRSMTGILTVMPEQNREGLVGYSKVDYHMGNLIT